MDKSKTRNLYIFFGIVILFIAFRAIWREIKFDYQMIEKDGRHYIVFDDPEKYGMILNDDFDGHMIREPHVIYPTARELVRAVKCGQLTKDDKKEISLFFRTKSNWIESCDFDNFYQAIPAKGWNVSGVDWTGNSYTYDFDNGEITGHIKVYSNIEDYNHSYQYIWEKYYSDVQVIQTEYSDDGKKEIIYYSNSTTPTDIADYKVIRYSLRDADKKIYIQRKYELSSGELVRINVFCKKGNAYYTVAFADNSRVVGDISDETLLQFDVEKVVFISPMVGVVIFIGVGLGGYYVNKLIKRRKRKAIINSTASDTVSSN